MRAALVAFFACALVATVTFGEVDTEDGEMMMELMEPKFSELIQTAQGSDCKADIAKITSLKDEADTRASKSDADAQKQSGIARRCLAAEQLLSGDAQSRREKLRDHIKQEVSVVEEQYAAKTTEMAKQCSDKIELARKEEAAKSGAGVDSAVQKEQARMKEEIDKFAAEKAAFTLKEERMKLSMKVELDNVQKDVTDAKKKQLEAEEALKKAQRTIQSLEEQLQREAAVAAQKLQGVEAQLHAKEEECAAAQATTAAAREAAREAKEQTSHVQLSAKAASTAEHVQVVKLKNALELERAKDHAQGSTVVDEKVALEKMKIALDAAAAKDEADEAEIAKEQARIKELGADGAEAQKALDAKIARLKSEKEKVAADASQSQLALANEKNKAISNDAKDAVQEGQVKGQLTVVLGKLKGDKATIEELRKEMEALRQRKEGGAGIELKAKLVEAEIRASQKEASEELTRARAKEQLLDLQVKELRKSRDEYRTRLEAKEHHFDAKVATKDTEIKVCMARSIGYQRQIAACIGAEKALKREELSMQALTKLSKEKLAGALRKRRKQLAICQAKATGLERHLQDKMVLKTKLESTEHVLSEWKSTGAALQEQVHRLTLQRNEEMLKQQAMAMKLSGAHEQLARAGIKVEGLDEEQKALLEKKHELVLEEHHEEATDKLLLSKEDQHLQVCRLKVRKLIGSLRVSALKLGALKVAYQSGKGKASRQIARVDIRLRKCEATSRLKLDLSRKKQHAAESLAGSARARLRACVKFRGKSELLMKHMATAEAKFQQESQLLKTDTEKLRKTMEINAGLTTALADTQKKQKMSSAQAASVANGLKICEHVAKSIEDKYKIQLQERNRAYANLLKTWNEYKDKNKGLEVCEKISANLKIQGSVCEANLKGSQEQLTVCTNAEKDLKTQSVRVVATKQKSEEELVKHLESRGKQVAQCQIQVASLTQEVAEGKKCESTMEALKEKFKGVAEYLKANANKWKKKDALEELEEKKEGGQARAMARGLSRAERKIARKEEEIKKLTAQNAAEKAATEEKTNLLRQYKTLMTEKLRKIKKVLWNKSQGDNKEWLQASLKKCHESEVALHNKWVSSEHESKMSLELCRRAGKVALTMEKNSCARVETRAALAKRASGVALDMCKKTSKRLETRAALASRAGKVSLDMCLAKKESYKKTALACKN